MQHLTILMVAVMVGAESTLSQLGSVYLITPQRYQLNPRAVYRNQREFANKFGTRGVHLIEALGTGYNPNLHSNLTPAPDKQVARDLHQSSNPVPAPDKQVARDLHQRSNPVPAPDKQLARDLHQRSNPVPAPDKQLARDLHQRSNPVPAPDKQLARDLHQRSNPAPANYNSVR
ncbi:uncharacterized protein [Procambarus clarkii]|uniref:uncharacterized protein n=1 Tax=Procambarus clarkii TaxID=6728 RepID=UPI0037446EDC